MSSQTEIRYLSPVDIDKRNRDKYCRFKKMGIKYIDYKDPDFLMRFLRRLFRSLGDFWAPKVPKRLPKWSQN